MRTQSLESGSSAEWLESSRLRRCLLDLSIMKNFIISRMKYTLCMLEIKIDNSVD